MDPLMYLSHFGHGFLSCRDQSIDSHEDIHFPRHFHSSRGSSQCPKQFGGFSSCIKPLRPCHIPDFEALTLFTHLEAFIIWFDGSTPLEDASPSCLVSHVSRVDLLWLEDRAMLICGGIHALETSLLALGTCFDEPCPLLDLTCATCVVFSFFEDRRWHSYRLFFTGEVSCHVLRTFPCIWERRWALWALVWPP